MNDISVQPPARRSLAMRLRQASPGLLSLIAVAAFLFVFPVVMFVIGAFRTAAPGLPGSWNFTSFPKVLSSLDTWHTFGNSVFLSVSVLFFATLLGLFFAWIVARTTTPLRHLVTPMMVLIFAVPPLFFALSWGMLANNPSGLLNKGWSSLTGGGSFLTAQSWYGLIGAETLKATSVSYLLLLGPILAMDRSMEEASLMAGAGRMRTLFRINIPSLGPALTGPLILGFVIGIGALDMPLILGLPAGIRVFPTDIYAFIVNSTPADYARADSLGMLLIALVIILVFAQRRLLKGRSFATVVGKSYRTDPSDIGPWKWACAGMIALYGLLALVLPLGQLIVGSLQPYFGVYGRWTMSNYSTVLHDPNTLATFERTIIVGVLSGLIASSFAFLAAYVARVRKNTLGRLPLNITWLIWGVPGVTLGLAMVWAYLTIPGLRSLYATIWIVVIALVVAVTPIAARVGEGAITQLGAELEESALVHGASRIRVFIGIVLRLVLPSFLMSWFITSVLAAGNLDVPILLSSPTNTTVPLQIYDLYNTSRVAEAAALFCVLLAVIAAAIVAVFGVRLIMMLRRRVMSRRAGAQGQQPRSGQGSSPLDEAAIPRAATEGHVAVRVRP